MTALIRQIQPVWFQLQQRELPLPPHALRNALLALASIARRDPSLAMAVGVRARDIAADESEDPIVRAAAEALMAARGGAG